MESQQSMETRDYIERCLELRGLILEVDAINEIISFSSTFPACELVGVNLVLDFLETEPLFDGMADGPSIIETEIVHWAVSKLLEGDDPFPVDNYELLVSTENASYLNLDDYVFFDYDLDGFIDESFDNDMSNNCFGAPPASKSAIEALPNIKITHENSSSCLQCAVSQEENFEVNEEVKQMPCKHIYHANCIIPWLELHNSCPLCRYSIATDVMTNKPTCPTSAPS